MATRTGTVRLMHIAVVSNTAWYLFNFRLNLMHALQAAGHTVVAVAPHDRYADRIKKAGILFEQVSISGSGINPFKELLSVAALWRLLRRQRINLVLSYTPKGNLYSSLAAIPLGVPFVPNVSGLGRTFIHKSLMTLVVHLLYRLTLHRAAHVFFQNMNDLNIFIKAGLVSANQAERLPGSGVDLQHFLLKKPATRAHDAPVFLLPARLLWDKGVGEYVDAARSVQKKYPSARFQLLGFLDVANPSAISRSQVEAWAAEGIIEYLGYTDDVRSFLTDADCVVLPSYREGVPRTLLEAAATGRAVITTDAPGCRDAAINGKTGFICRPADAQDLAEKMLQFIALTPDARYAMGLRGRQFMEAEFDERKVLDRYSAAIAVIAALSTQQA